MTAAVAQLTMVASFDLGGTFPSSQAVIEGIKKGERFAAARAGFRLGDRVQPSYRYVNQPDVLACEEEVELRLDSWEGAALQRITLHPMGVATFEIKMPLGPGGIERCTQVEEDFYDANVVRYEPYLMKAHSKCAPDPAGDDRGVDLITPVQELRELLAGIVVPRPEGIVYPGTDMRTVVSATVDDLDASGVSLVQGFVSARRARAQLAEAASETRDLEGRRLEVHRPKVTARRWGCVLFASCDVDAVLLVTDKAEDWAQPVATNCVAMAQTMWFIARTWVGVLDKIGTVQIREDDLDEAGLRDLQRKVIDLSAAEFEIENSMATVEAAGVMLRDSWHVQLVGATLECFEVGLQRRLIDQRLNAVARNHATVAEVLDRVHQNAARAQADRLQYLFSVAVAAGLAALALEIADLKDAEGRAALGVGTLVLVWAILALGIWWVGRLRIPLTRATTRRQLRR